MDFGEATDRAMELGVSLQEIADALGIAYTTIRAHRLDPASDSYRRPPDGWEPKLATLAQARAKGLQELAGRLSG